MSKNRNYIFTHNNYELSTLDYYNNLQCKFIAYSKEIAPTTGTEHLQGYVCWTSPLSHSSAKKRLPGAWCQAMVGSLDQNDAYISKLTQPIERGDKPVSNDNKGRAEQLRWQRIKESAKAGRLEEIDAKVFITQYNTLKRIAADYKTKPINIEDVCGVWIWGQTGVGKSHCVDVAFPDAYKKSGDHWWYNYQDEDVVWIDEFDACMVKPLGRLLKQWADKYPFQAEFKGGYMTIRPKRIIVTSNYSPETLFNDKTLLLPILRKFIVIEKLTKEQNIIF
nr:MAG: replication associated protein [Cressdnaviricota sp.]